MSESESSFDERFFHPAKWNPFRNDPEGCQPPQERVKNVYSYIKRIRQNPRIHPRNVPHLEQNGPARCLYTNSHFNCGHRRHSFNLTDLNSRGFRAFLEHCQYENPNINMHNIYKKAVADYSGMDEEEKDFWRKWTQMMALEPTEKADNQSKILHSTKFWFYLEMLKMQNKNLSDFEAFQMAMNHCQGTE